MEMVGEQFGVNNLVVFFLFNITNFILFQYLSSASLQTNKSVTNHNMDY